MRGVALVTGAAGGIGAAVARRLASDGYAVACLDLDGDGAAKVAADLEGALAVTCDVADEESVAAAVGAVRSGLGEVAVLVNAAGYFDRHDVPELSVREWRRFMDVNAMGPFLTCREVLPAMVVAGRQRRRKTPTNPGASVNWRERRTPHPPPWRRTPASPASASPGTPTC